jgi:hypothetical protein
LSLVFLFLFLLVIVLGIEALGSLSYVNDAAAQIRLRWLPSTRALGDINNLTTDFPAAEASLRRAGSASERAPALQQMADLDRGIATAQLAYRQIRHDAAEDELYGRFDKKWRDYRHIVASDAAASVPGTDVAARLLREQSSTAAYGAAKSGVYTLMLSPLLATVAIATLRMFLPARGVAINGASCSSSGDPAPRQSAYSFATPSKIGASPIKPK